VTKDVERLTLKQTGTRRSRRNFALVREEIYVSIVRIGLAETKKFAEGYEAIFGKKKTTDSKKTKAPTKSAAAKKKKKTTKKK
jgi:hypothetical protein